MNAANTARTFMTTPRRTIEEAGDKIAALNGATRSAREVKTSPRAWIARADVRRWMGVTAKTEALPSQPPDNPDVAEMTRRIR